MGAPGEAFVCRRGHLYHWIEDHLYWTEDLFDESERIQRKGCLCGEKSVVVLDHYGAINDCRPEGEELALTGTETFRWRERIADAIDASGNPIEAYRDVERTLEVYDVSSLVFPSAQEATEEEG